MSYCSVLITYFEKIGKVLMHQAMDLNLQYDHIERSNIYVAHLLSGTSLKNI